MHIDDLNPVSFDQADEASVFAAVTGSVGSTASREEYDSKGQPKGNKTFAKVERVAASSTSPASLWRVADATDRSIVGVVFVRGAQPGRATSHALNDYVALADEMVVLS